MTTALTVRLPRHVQRLFGGLGLPGLLIALTLLPALLLPFELILVRQILIFSTLALSLDLLWGRAGQLSFGHAVFFGLGAYAFGIAGKAMGESNLIALLAGVVLPSGVAAILGYFIFRGRVRGTYFSIVTLSSSLVVSQLAISWAAVTGGDSGLTGIPPLLLGIGDVGLMVTSPEALFYLALAGAILAYAVVRALVSSEAGLVISAIRENESRAAFCGYDTPRYLILVLVVSAAIAGLAGVIFAATSSFVAPDLLGTLLSTEVVVWVAVGGRGTLIGAFVGTAVIRSLYSVVSPILPTSWPLVVGAFFIVSVLVIPDGIVGLMRRWYRTLRRRVPVRARTAEFVPESFLADGQRGGSPTGSQATVRNAAQMQLYEVTVRFGGLTAVRNLSMDFVGRPIYCVIGPNGAGKTTFFNVLSGAVRPDAGRVVLDGREITGLAPHLVAQLGVTRKFQIPSVFEGLSVFDNLVVAARAPRVGRPRVDHSAIVGRVEETITLLEMRGREAQLARSLSHGERQWLEIGMAIVSDPRLVLLDEPTAGLSPDETHRTAELVRQVATTCSVVVIEHDMQFVRDIASDVLVLHQGEVLRQGTMTEIEADHVVRDVYLGRTGVA